MSADSFYQPFAFLQFGGKLRQLLWISLNRGMPAECAPLFVKIFRDHGPREARSQCRLAHRIADWGMEELRYVLCERLMRPLEEAGEEQRADKAIQGETQRPE